MFQLWIKKKPGIEMFSHVQIKYEWINNIIWTPSAPIGISDKSVLLNHASYRKKISWISVWKILFLFSSSCQKWIPENFMENTIHS